MKFKFDPRKEAVKRFRERFKDYLKGEDEYLDNIRDRWTNSDVVYIYKWALKKGYRRGFEKSKHIPHKVDFLPRYKPKIGRRRTRR